MPYRDPEKKRERNREHMRQVRAAKKASVLSGDGSPVTPRPLENAPAKVDRAQLQSALEQLSVETWIAAKIQMGMTWFQLAEKMAIDEKSNKKDMVAVGKAAIELINANLTLYRPPTRGPKAGSALASDPALLSDPEYCAAAQNLLLTKQRVQARLKEERRRAQDP